jgi:Uma2 family endonuclease
MTSCDTLPISKAELDRNEPWTEAEFLALGQTDSRIELIDGGLWVSPSANTAHQGIAFLLMTALRPATRKAGLRWAVTPNLRLAPNRMVIPDLSLGRQPWATKVVDATETVLVVEVTSPSNAAMDRGQKKLFYAEAKIDWYLLVEPDFAEFESVTLRLLRLDGDKYLEYSTAGPGESLISAEPFPMKLSTGDLVDP